MSAGDAGPAVGADEAIKQWLHREVDRLEGELAVES
jgi:hypothetical protein